MKKKKNLKLSKGKIKRKLFVFFPKDGFHSFQSSLPFSPFFLPHSQTLMRHLLLLSLIKSRSFPVKWQNGRQAISHPAQQGRRKECNSNSNSYLIRTELKPGTWDIVLGKQHCIICISHVSILLLYYKYISVCYLLVICASLPLSSWDGDNKG